MRGRVPRRRGAESRSDRGAGPSSRRLGDRQEGTAAPSLSRNYKSQPFGCQGTVSTGASSARCAEGLRDPAAAGARRRDFFNTAPSASPAERPNLQATWACAPGTSSDTPRRCSASRLHGEEGIRGDPAAGIPTRFCGTGQLAAVTQLLEARNLSTARPRRPVAGAAITTQESRPEVTASRELTIPDGEPNPCGLSRPSKSPSRSRAAATSLHHCIVPRVRGRRTGGRRTTLRPTVRQTQPARGQGQGRKIPLLGRRQQNTAHVHERQAVARLSDLTGNAHPRGVGQSIQDTTSRAT